MLECKLGEINRIKHTIPFKMQMHTHKYNELTYYISGNGTTKIGSTVYNYKAGTFAFYKSGTAHNEINPEPCDIIWVHFSYNIENINLKEGVYTDPDGQLFACLQRLRNASYEQRKYRTLLIESCLAEAIVTAAAQQSEPETLTAGLNWEQILDYIDANKHNDIDFVSLARNHHYSYDRFRHLFREHFGISLHAYLTKQRINHAKRLLKSSTFSLTDIAYDCGFKSSSQFTNIFKKHTGLTPKEYRKKRTNIV